MDDSQVTQYTQHTLLFLSEKRWGRFQRQRKDRESQKPLVVLWQPGRNYAHTCKHHKIWNNEREKTRMKARPLLNSNNRDADRCAFVCQHSKQLLRNVSCLRQQDLEVRCTEWSSKTVPIKNNMLSCFKKGWYNSLRHKSWLRFITTAQQKSLLF